MTFASLQPLADRASVYVYLHQDALAEATAALGEHRWDVDMVSSTLTFTSHSDPQAQIVAHAHFVASIAPGPRSLLWGWAHPQGQPDGVAAQIRDYGQQHGIEALSAESVNFPEDTGDDLEAWIAGAAHQIGTIAVELTGHAPYYSAPLGGGTRAVFVLDTEIARPTVQQLVTKAPRMLSTLEISDFRSAIWDAARLAGWNLEWTDEAYSGAVVTDATGSATFRFDEHARVTGIESTLGA